MKKTILSAWCAAALLLLWCSTAFCIQCEIDRCITQLEKRYESLKDFQASFEQETHLGSINRVEKGEGFVSFKKGGKMLWEYTTPTAQKIILDGKTLWLYLPDEKQVMKNNFSAIPSHIVVDLFRGQINIQHKFKVMFIQEEVKNNTTLLAMELVPLIYDPTITKLTLWIDPETFFIIRTSLEDEFGTRTALRFFNIKADKGIDDALFEFTPPEGVEVFEPPQQ